MSHTLRSAIEPRRAYAAELIAPGATPTSSAAHPLLPPRTRAIVTKGL
jgi:hypothetical protein